MVRSLWRGALDARPFDAPGVRDATLGALLDVLACTLAARRDPGVATLLAGSESAARGRPVLGHHRPLTRADAALVGGFQAHALDWDDVHAEVRGHPSAVLFPALWALADDDTPGEAFLAAYAVGVEVMARLGRLAGPSHHAAGWHPTATLGAMAAAVAGARLRGLGSEATDAAFGLAASQTGGTRAQFGSPAKPLHAGLSAAAAVRSVLWAQAGVTAGADPLLGPDGLARAMAFGGTDPGVLADRWGRRWAIVDPGLWFKRFPFCSAAMSAHEAAETLASEGRWDAASVLERVSGVRVVMRPGADAALAFGTPATGAQGRFSSEYLVGLALAGVPAVEGRFVELDPRALALARRTSRASEGEPSRTPWARVEVELADGTTTSATVGVPRGAPGRPLSASDRRDKLDAAVGDAEPLLTAVATWQHGTVGDLARAIARATDEGGVG